MQGADILDQRDPMGRSFAGSLFFHGGLLALIIIGPQFMPKPLRLGDPMQHSGTMGVNIVKTIPIPQREGPKNPVANDTKAVAPQEPKPKTPPKPAVKEPPTNAVKIPTQEKPTPRKRPHPVGATPDYTPEARYRENQLYSQTAPALVSPQYGIQGTNGVGISQANPFGEQFGWYAAQIQDRISRKWNRSDVTSRPHAKAVVRFELLADGSVRNVQLAQTSGSYTLDSSAQRALIDASPLPPLPKALNRNSITIDLEFELQQ